jgi:hypothetical protein
MLIKQFNYYQENLPLFPGIYPPLQTPVQITGMPHGSSTIPSKKFTLCRYNNSIVFTESFSFICNSFIKQKVFKGQGLLAVHKSSAH